MQVYHTYPFSEFVVYLHGLGSKSYVPTNFPEIDNSDGSL